MSKCWLTSILGKLVCKSDVLLELWWSLSSCKSRFHSIASLSNGHIATGILKFLGAPGGMMRRGLLLRLFLLLSMSATMVLGSAAIAKADDPSAPRPSCQQIWQLRDGGSITVENGTFTRDSGFQPGYGDRIVFNPTDPDLVLQAGNGFGFDVDDKLSFYISSLDCDYTPVVPTCDQITALASGELQVENGYLRRDGDNATFTIVEWLNAIAGNGWVENSGGALTYDIGAMSCPAVTTPTPTPTSSTSPAAGDDDAEDDQAGSKTTPTKLPKTGA